MLASIMEDCLENLDGLRDGDEVVFLISNHYPAKWDFARLSSKRMSDALSKCVDQSLD